MEQAGFDPYKDSRAAAEITIEKIDSYDELNAPTGAEGDAKFAERTRALWDMFTVSGVLQFDKQKGEQVLQQRTDLDGKSALALLSKAGIDTSNIRFVRPGTSEEGSINLDTGDKSGVVFEPETGTAFFDHHEKGGPVSSTTEIVYKTLIALKMLESTEAMDRVVDYVTKIDNRKFGDEQFTRSAKTVLGLQRTMEFETLERYFEDHASATEEMSPEEIESLGLKEVSEKQQQTVDRAMETLERMEGEGKVEQVPPYGSIVINENGELQVGSSAAYIRHDGILNLTPGKSFAFTLKVGKIDETKLKERLGERFQGKIIRGNMWIFNEPATPLELDREEILGALKES